MRVICADDTRQSMKVMNANKLHHTQPERHRPWMHNRIEAWLACATALTLLGSTSAVSAEGDSDQNRSRTLQGQQNEKTRRRLKNRAVAAWDRTAGRATTRNMASACQTSEQLILPSLGTRA